MKHHIEVSAPTKASVETVFTAMKDGNTWPVWCSSITSFELEREGLDRPEGVGAVRAFLFKGRTTRARIIEVTEPGTLRYQLLSGLPLVGYTGKGTATPGLIRWDLDFSVKESEPDDHWHKFMEEFIGEFVQELAAYADRQNT